MRKFLISVSIVFIIPVAVYAGFSFGLIKAAKKKVDKVNEQVVIKKTEALTTTSNRLPVISFIVANPTTISTGAVSAITCTASDADSDTLTYTWTAASGTITGTGATVNWTAPASSSTYTINIAVSDGHGGSDQASVNITVFVSEWVLVPGNPLFGTSDFYVMKYEAKNVGGVAVSQADAGPWGSIDHPSAIAACAALGAGAHLLTIPEVQTINRNIEAQTANWADGIIGSLVSAGGGLKRGNVGITDSASYNGNDPEYGTGRNTKAKLVLSNNGELWDWSGNVWEWVYGAGAAGTLGTPEGVTFTTGTWYEWDHVALNEERPIVGPSNNSWTCENGMGVYWSDASTGVIARSGYWASGANTGLFSFVGAASYSLFDIPPSLGFRCGR